MFCFLTVLNDQLFLNYVLVHIVLELKRKDIQFQKFHLRIEFVKSVIYTKLKMNTISLCAVNSMIVTVKSYALVSQKFLILIIFL